MRYINVNQHLLTAEKMRVGDGRTAVTKFHTGGCTDMLMYILTDANGVFVGAYSSQELANSARASFEGNLFAQVSHAQPYVVRVVQVDP